MLAGQMALVLAAARRRLEPLLRLALILVIAGAISLLGWGPYLVATIHGHPADSGTAQHYLPAAVSRIVSVGCSRNDNSVVPSSVVSIDSNDQA